MGKQINITIENKLLLEERDMNVYHHSTRSAYIISHDNRVTLPLKPAEADDFLHISIVSGPGRLESRCVINLPSCIDFELSAVGDAAVFRSGERTLLTIPPGPPNWQIKMTRSLSSFNYPSSERIIVGDSQQEQL